MFAIDIVLVSLRCSGKPKFAYTAFSTVAYGVRSYSPELGRWVNRDPIGENGGVNILTFIQNNTTNLFDLLGMDSIAVYDGDDKGPGEYPWYTKEYWMSIADGSDFTRVALKFDRHINIGYLNSDLTRLAEWLEAQHNYGVEIDRLVFIDHGTPGYQEFGFWELITPGSVTGRPYSLQSKTAYERIRNVLTPDAVIELHGCKVAEGSVGQIYLQKLANLFQRKVIGWTGKTLIKGEKCKKCYENKGKKVEKMPLGAIE